MGGISAHPPAPDLKIRPYALRSTGVPIPPISTSNDNRPQEKPSHPTFCAMVGHSLTEFLTAFEKKARGLTLSYHLPASKSGG